jgi:hypothetical protein
VIVTDVDFVVQRTLKGQAAAGSHLRITRLGGELEESDVALTVPGEATFAVGQTVLVFLRRASDELRVVGMAQGVMPIAGTGAQATIQTRADGPLRLERTPDGTLKPVEPLEPEAPRQLADVVQEVERLVAGSGH